MSTKSPGRMTLYLASVFPFIVLSESFPCLQVRQQSCRRPRVTFVAEVNGEPIFVEAQGYEVALRCYDVLSRLRDDLGGHRHHLLPWLRALCPETRIIYCGTTTMEFSTVNSQAINKMPERTQHRVSICESPERTMAVVFDFDAVGTEGVDKADVVVRLLS